MSDRAATIARLHRRRPRRPFVIWSVRVMALIVGLSWLVGDFSLADWLTERRMGNLQRFLTELQPWPVQESGGDWSGVPAWAAQQLGREGGDALLRTLAVSVAAMVLAAGCGALLSLGAARNLATPEPMLPAGRRPRRLTRVLWQALVWSVRSVLVVVRAVPEYVWAFLFLALLGPTAWPMVLALALHNTGILGKLSADLIENVDHQSAGALRAAGAGRFQMVWAAILPLSMPRFLLYFFYRWETCVREATVLGMLGMASLGFLIQDARARNHHDEMFLFILAGAGLVLVGDLVSLLSRRFVRRA